MDREREKHLADRMAMLEEQLEARRVFDEDRGKLIERLKAPLMDLTEAVQQQKKKNTKQCNSIVVLVFICCASCACLTGADPQRKPSWHCASSLAPPTSR